MERVGSNVFQLTKHLHAWNVDGSSDDRLVSSSWIKHWESETGLQRDVCSFRGCSGDAEHGGHVWIKRHAVFIVPICRRCNWYGNERRYWRVDGNHSSLRAGAVIVKSEYTEAMRYSGRRVAIVARVCNACDLDISARPKTHTQCLNCFRNAMRLRRKVKKF